MKRYVYIAMVAALGLFLACWPAAHADPVLTPYIGGHSISYTGDPHLPSDFEGGGGGSISLSPHVSAVGGAWYGFGRSYLRGTIGGRFTVTDASDPNFSIGIGGAYNASSKVAVRPQEATGDVSLGWRPYPENWPRAVVVAQASYGFESERAYLLLGLRYALNPF